MPHSPILPKWVNSVSSQTDGSVFPSIGGSILVSVKVDDETFEKINQLSEEKERTKSWIVRDIIVRRLLETGSL